MASRMFSIIVCAGIGISAAVGVSYLSTGSESQTSAVAADTPAKPQSSTRPATVAVTTAKPAPTTPAPAPTPAAVPPQQEAVPLIISQKLAFQQNPVSPAVVAVEPRELAARKPDLSNRPYLPLTEPRKAPLNLPVKTLPPKRPTLATPELPALATVNPDAPAAPPLRTIARHTQETIIPPNPLMRLPLVFRPRVEPISSSLPTTLNDIVCPPLSMLPAFRTTGAPFKPTIIADPLANQNEVTLVTAPPDTDPPAPARAILPRQPMPVGK